MTCVCWGIALTRSGNSRGIEVWEQARSPAAEPPRDTLRADACVFQSRPACRCRRDRPTTGRLSRLERPGRGAARGHRAGSRRPGRRLSSFGGKRLTAETAEKEAGALPIVPPKEFARALLQTRRPEEARLQLERVLSVRARPRGFLAPEPRLPARRGEEQSAGSMGEVRLVPRREPACPRAIAIHRFESLCRVSFGDLSISAKLAARSHFLSVSELGESSFAPGIFPRSWAREGHALTSASRRPAASTGNSRRGSSLFRRRGLRFRLGRSRGDPGWREGQQDKRSSCGSHNIDTGTGLRWDLTSGHFPHPDEPLGTWESR